MARTRTRNRRGNIITTVLLVPVLLGVGSVSVDLGQAFVSRTQLQNVTDLSSRSAVGLLDGTSQGMTDAVEAALAVARANDVLGQEVLVDEGDVLTGTWVDGSFVQSTDPTVVDAIRIQARSETPVFFADLLLGVSSIPVSTLSISVNEEGGAGAVDCWLPLAIPDCVLDSTPEADLQDMELTFSPAGIDNVGWARLASDGNASASWVRHQLADCETGGTVMVGDLLWLNNGLHNTNLMTIDSMLEASSTTWNASVYGELPAQMSNSSVSSSDYGQIVEGPILVFEGDSRYCSGNGKWNDKDVVVTGMVWAAIYDVASHGGGAASKNVKVRLDLDREHQVGTDTGGTDYGVIAGSPALVY